MHRPPSADRRVVVANREYFFVFSRRFSTTDDRVLGFRTRDNGPAVDRAPQIRQYASGINGAGSGLVRKTRVPIRRRGMGRL